jgi:hypothetical protein
MATISARRFKFWSKALGLCCAFLLANVPAHGQPAGSEGSKSAPQDPNSTRSGTRPGETLSERLDRDNGAIRPPAGTDPHMAVPAPEPAPKSMPVIPPPGSPDGDRFIRPK